MMMFLSFARPRTMRRLVRLKGTGRISGGVKRGAAPCRNGAGVPCSVLTPAPRALTHPHVKRPCCAAAGCEEGESSEGGDKPAPVKGLRAVAAEALKRLGIETSPTKLEQAYSAGEMTQVPAGRAIAVRKRVRRKIGHNGTYVSFERDRPGSR